MRIQTVFEAIRKRHLPHWLVAYAAGGWGLTEATGFVIDNYGFPQRLLDLVVFLLIVGLFVVIVLVWYHGERGPQRPTRVEGLLLAGLAVWAAIGGVRIATSGPSAPASTLREPIAVADLGARSLAVLPFRNAVDDADLAWLDHGLAELLSTNLAQDEDLRVVSGQRIFDVLVQLGVDPDDATSEPSSVLAALSGARLIVTGSVFGDPSELTVSATLAEAETGEIRASARARGDDIFDLVDEIAAGLRAGLRTESLVAASITSLATADIEAYRAYREGQLASQRFLHAEAERHFGRAVELDSTFALARFRHALALYQLGSVSEAVEEAARARRELAQASERDRLFVEAFDGFQTDTTRAVATVRELVRKYPDDKDARIIFGGILAALRGSGDPEARTLIRETLELDPSYAPGYNMLAYAHAGDGDLEIADSLIARYVELEPDAPNPWDSRGEILELAGRMEEAREAYRQALRVHPDFRIALNHLARSFLQEDDAVGGREALAPYRRSELPAVRVRAGALTADTHLWEGDVDRAVEAYEAAEREAFRAGLPDLRVWRLRDLVRVRLALGQFDAAAAAADTIRRLEPLDGWWITALYDSLIATGNVAELERWKPVVLSDIEEHRPEGLPMISRLIDAWIAYARGDHPEVLSLVADLPAAMRPGVLTGWPFYRSMLELGQAEALLGMLEDVRDPDLFQRGPRFEPIQMRWAQYFEARAYEALGDTAAAVAGYEALVRGMGEGLDRFPTIADARSRLAALQP